MTDKEAMAMALEALECANSPNGDYENEIAALKTRLAQEKALQALHDENARLGLYRDAYGQPEQEPLIGCVNHDCAKCKERTEQEPVGYVYSELGVKSAAIQINLPNGTPLYTHPPQREWVGLTNQEQLDIFAQSVAKKRSEYKHYKAIEQALKEKNQ